MARRGENIYLRKDGRWEGRYIKRKNFGGKSKFGYVYGRKYTEVKKRLCKLKAEIQAGKDAVEQYGDLWTLNEWSDYWLDCIAKPHIKSTTYESYKNQLVLHIQSYLGEKFLSEIDHVLINDFISHIRKYLSNSTACGVYRLLKSILVSGIKKKLLPAISFEEVRKPRNKTKCPRILTRLEQNKLEREICKQDSNEYLLGLYVGLRLGEICALRWKDIDFTNNTLNIIHAAKRVKVQAIGSRAKTKVIVSETKSETSKREIPVPKFLMKRLAKRYKNISDADGFVFPGRNGHICDPRTMQQRLYRLTEKIGIKGIHMHTLRHSFATRCLEQNIGMETLSDFLGHSSPEITWRYYAHCTWEHKKESIGRLQPMAC